MHHWPFEDLVTFVVYGVPPPPVETDGVTVGEAGGVDTGVVGDVVVGCWTGVGVFVGFAGVVVVAVAVPVLSPVPTTTLGAVAMIPAGT